MPLNQTDSGEQSWRSLSTGWPETSEHAWAKYLLCTQFHAVPYGSYVIVGDVLRIENIDDLTNLNQKFSMLQEAILRGRR